MRVRERIERMEVGDRVESNHQPLIVKIREGDKEGRGGKSRGKLMEMDREGKKEFKEKLGRMQEGEIETEKEWERMKGRIKEVLEEGNKEKGKGNRRGWFDEECKEEKKKLRRELRKWRREGGMEKGIKRKKGNTERYMREKRQRRIRSG